MNASRPLPIPPREWRPIVSLLPRAEETVFVRAASRPGDPGRGAWRQWVAGARRVAAGDEGLVRVLSSYKAFVPLLAWNLARNGVEPTPPVRTYLRSAELTEDLRWRKYGHICAQAFAAFDDAAVPFLALKGAAFGERYYARPQLRHAGDIDVLVRAGGHARAAAALVARGWKQQRATTLMARHLRHGPPVVHPSGLPLELHVRLAPSCYPFPYDDLWAASRNAVVAGRQVRVLSHEDDLHHALVHGMGGERWLRWVFDALSILDAVPRIDWPLFVARVRAARTALPVFAALEYLATDLEAAVPAPVLDDLHVMAAASGRRARRAARPLPGGSPLAIWSSPAPLPARMARLFRRAFPAPADLRVHFDIPWWQLPFDYAHRIARYARYAAGRIGRSAGS